MTGVGSYSASTLTLPEEVLTRMFTAPGPPLNFALRFSKVPGKSLRIVLPELVLAVPEISVPGGSLRVTLPELAPALIEAPGGIVSH